MPETDVRRIASEPENSTQTSIPALPFDLFEPILGQLGSHPSEERLARRSYGSIGLVCRVFLPYAQRLLFSRIVIGHPIPVEETNFGQNVAHHYLTGLENKRIDQRRLALTYLMDDNPSIASYIRHMSYVVFPQELTCTKQQNEEPNIARFLHLPNLRSLDIKARYKIDYGGCLPSYREANPDSTGFRRVVERYLSAGVINTLSFTRINDIPIGDILSSPSLEKLTLAYCTITDWSPNQQSSDDKKPLFGLKDLTLYDMAYTMHPVLPYLDQLQSLRVDYPFRYGGSDRSMRNQAEPRAPSAEVPLAFRKLQVLEYVNYRRCPPQWTYFTDIAERRDMTGFPELKKLTIDVRSHQYNPYRKSLQSDKIRDIKNLLGHAPSLDKFSFVEYDNHPDMIQEVELRGYVDQCRELSFHIPYKDVTSGETLRSLCRNLQQIERRNRLERLVINLDMREPQHDSDKHSTMVNGPSMEAWSTFQDIILRDTSSFPSLVVVEVHVSVMRPSGSEISQWLAKRFSPADLNVVKRSLEERLERILVSKSISLDVSVYYVEVCEFQG